MWARVNLIADQIKKGIEGTQFSFKDAKVPRTTPSHRLQALVNETPERNQKVQNRTAEDHFRVTCCYASIDKVVPEMRSRFEGNDQKVLCALANVVFSGSPTSANIKFVSEFYGVDSELLSKEKAVFESLEYSAEYSVYSFG